LRACCASSAGSPQRGAHRKAERRPAKRFGFAKSLRVNLIWQSQTASHREAEPKKPSASHWRSHLLRIGEAIRFALAKPKRCGAKQSNAESRIWI
jgi:hypothetical protein